MRGGISDIAKSEWHQDDADHRGVQPFSIGDTSLQIEIMIDRGSVSDRPTFLIINSIDFPIPPSRAFCDLLWAAGYQVIFCRRPGFGNLPGLPAPLLTKDQVKNGSAVAAETALFSMLIKELGLKDVTLLGLGTSNSICYRLGQLNPEITFTIFSNPLFHPSIWDVIKPQWLKRMIRQTLLSRSGLKIAVRGLKAVLRRDPIWFYRQFAQKSTGDQEYVSQNLADFREAGLMLQNISPDTFYYDLQYALVEDTCWDPEITRQSNAVILSGHQTTAKWKRAITAEAARLQLPIVFADSGDLFVAYASRTTLLDIVKARTDQKSKASTTA
ncbi:MAG: hypothetical protein AAF437_09780 [Pseudomonadota bacterium]